MWTIIQTNKNNWVRQVMKKSELSNGAEQVIYQEIHRAIAQRRLQPGTKLVEETLADIYSVSRARIRKVFLLLAKENIIQLIPNKGAFVWRPTIKEARDVLDARRAVELFLIKQAPKCATKANIKKLRDIVQQEQQAINSNDDAQRMTLSGQFHIALAECASNPIMTEFLSELISRCYLIIATYETSSHGYCPDHAVIVDLVENKDSDGALFALEEHFDHVEAALDLRDKPEAKTDLKEIFSTP